MKRQVVNDVRLSYLLRDKFKIRKSFSYILEKKISLIDIIVATCGFNGLQNVIFHQNYSTEQ